MLLQPLTGVPAEEAAEGTLSPEATAGLFSTLTFKWISPLMSKVRSSGDDICVDATLGSGTAFAQTHHGRTKSGCRYHTLKFGSPCTPGWPR